MKIYTYLVIFSLMFLFETTLYGQNADIDLLRKINVGRNKSYDNPMKFISNTEAFMSIGIPVGVCFSAIVMKDKKLMESGITMTLALATNTAYTYILKRTINRARPATTYSLIEPLEYDRYHSFPSGHTSRAFTTATSLSLQYRKWYVVAPSFLWASTVAYSRMHLGMHYPSDVFAGAILGVGSSWAMYHTNKWLKRKFKQKYVDKRYE